VIFAEKPVAALFPA